MALVLASQSPRRRQLMALVWPDFELDEAQGEEDMAQELAPAALAAALARQKALEVATRRPRDVVIGCDTVVELDGRPLGKPHTRQEAGEMMTALSGSRHLVHTGVYIAAPGGREQAFCETTTVYFAPVGAQEIAAYVATDEPYDKAGGYGIQGAGARWVTRVEGCYYNVMGLPVARLYSTLADAGLLPLGGPNGGQANG